MGYAAMADLDSLGPKARARILTALRALDPDTPVTDLDWSSLVAAAKSDLPIGPGQTVGNLLAEVAKAEGGPVDYRAALIAGVTRIGRNLEGPGYRLGFTASDVRPDPTTPADPLFTAWLAEDRRLERYCERYGDHRYDPDALPWPESDPEIESENQAALRPARTTDDEEDE